MTSTEKPIIGRVSFISGETQEFTDAEEYLTCIREELPHEATTGFRFRTITQDPAIRKAVDDIVYDFYFARKKMLYEDAAHHNAVFIGTDEGGCPRHAHLRSTNSFGKAFRLNVEASDPRYSFHHTGTDGSLYVFEAPIDMLSYISMNPRQWQEHSYVACCGTSPIPVMQMLKPDTQIVYLCLDNDDAGHKASERMAELLHKRGVMTERLVPEMKDWNEELLHAQKEDLALCLSL